MDKIWLAVDEVVEDTQRWNAYVVEVVQCDNIIKKLEPRYKNGKIGFVSFYKTKKQAERVVDIWNNGTQRK